MKVQKIIAVSGVKNSGKTTLIERIIPILAGYGVSTAVIKHDGHSFSPDRPNTDTYRFLSAGAVGTAVLDSEKYQAVKYISVTEQKLISLYPEANLILLEGFKHSAYPKIEIVRAEIFDKSVCDRKTLIAAVTNIPQNFSDIPVFGINDISGIAEFIYNHLKEDG